MGSQPPPLLDNWIYNCNADKKQTIKNLQRFASIQICHTLTKKNDNINMASTIARSMKYL